MLGIYGTVYNSVDTIRQTIEDLKSKLKEDFVIVVTDNYSTDGTYEILKEYDFVDVIRMKCTRGMGRQKALEHLIKNYKEVDFIFYIDFDVKFKDFTQKMLNEIKKRYQEGEIYWAIASYDTYRNIIRRVAWSDSNMGEDFLWHLKLINNNFKLYLFAFSYCTNQIRFKRERKYTKNKLKLLKRIVRNYLTFYIYNGFNILKYFIKNKILLLDVLVKADILFPEDLKIDKNYLLLIIRSFGDIPDHIKEKIIKNKDDIKIRKFKSKSKLFRYIVFYRDFDKIREDFLVFQTAIR